MLYEQSNVSVSYLKCYTTDQGPEPAVPIQALTLPRFLLLSNTLFLELFHQFQLCYLQSKVLLT